LFAQFQFTARQRQRRVTPEEHCRPSMPKVHAGTRRRVAQRAIFIAELSSPLSALSSFLAAQREAF